MGFQDIHSFPERDQFTGPDSASPHACAAADKLIEDCFPGNRPGMFRGEPGRTECSGWGVVSMVGGVS